VPVRIRMVGGVLSAVALAGCGSSGQSTATSSAQLPPFLSGRVLASNELAGLVPQGRTLSTSGAGWVAADETPPAQRTAEAQRLQKLGFLAGVREPLTATHGGAAGLSIAVQFRSPSAARSDLATEYKLSAASGEHVTAFAVPGIPGARGFELSGAGSSGANVAFTKGSFYYLVGESSATSPRADVIAAAQRLYDGLPS
jgi:hypothetical protein